MSGRKGDSQRLKPNLRRDMSVGSLVHSNGGAYFNRSTFLNHKHLLKIAPSKPNRVAEFCLVANRLKPHTRTVARENDDVAVTSHETVLSKR